MIQGGSVQQYVILENLPARRSPPNAIASGRTAAADTRVTVDSVPKATLADLRRDPRIAAVAPLIPTKLVVPSGSARPMAEAWGIVAVGADRTVSNGHDVVVAVLDTGVDTNHPAFVGITIEGENFTRDGHFDVVGHGTHCMGIICGRDVGDTQIGIARGVTRVLSGKVLNDKGAGNTAQLFSGLQWAIDKGANVVNLSLGFDIPGLVENLVDSAWPPALATSLALDAYRENLLMLNAFMAMVRARVPFGGDAVIIAAAGNESRRTLRPDYRIGASLPAAGQDIISVAALERSTGGLAVADFSNYQVCVSAPGVDILSAAPGGGLITLCGTSMAAPHVSGVAALWWDYLRNMGLKVSGELVRAKVIGTACISPLAPGFDPLDVGAGLACAP